MNKSCVVLIFNNNWEILLCMKKRWFWAWKWNWPGWKVKNWENITETMKRELLEETWINADISEFIHKWKINFSFLNKSEWNQEMTIFTINWFIWVAVESEEMKPEWFRVSSIPYEQMWDADKIWIPRVINNEEVEYNVLFDDKWSLLDCELIK